MEAQAELKQEKKINAPACCAGCVRWGNFGRRCWYYWEDKKHCTMWTADWEDAARQQF
ncbi:hypothetical protein KY347_06245 [Candidatus Woesearchaeota archaeon]|nr:hypothetical protein [Candidatus Woesearchaeota archaeon]